MGQTVKEGKIYLSKDDTFSQSFESLVSFGRLNV